MDGLAFKVGIIISTYNNPKWLQKTLWGYNNQTYPNFEIIIADDGSREDTKEMIESFKKESSLDITHVWHPDNGFQKTTILNKAILASTSDYLIFTDQDCIPRKDFVQTHVEYAQPGYFLSGGYFKLPKDISENITYKDIENQQAFNLKWLYNQGLKKTFKNTKLLKNNMFARFMNTITPANASWNGCNSSGWKKDMIEINGFNEDMQYGAEDREFGERLFNKGIRSKQIRYSAICIHLFHDRPYKNTEAMKRNNEIRKITKKEKVIKTPKGIIRE